jgi:hypothetical protein
LPLVTPATGVQLNDIDPDVAVNAYILKPPVLTYVPVVKVAVGYESG